MWRTLSRHRNISWRSLQLSRRSKSDWRTPPALNPYEPDAERFEFVRFLWRHKPTVLMAGTLLLIYQEYHKQMILFEKPSDLKFAELILLKAQAADKQYDQVNFDDPVQNIAYVERLFGDQGMKKDIDKILASLADDSRRQEVYNLCRQAAISTHSALAKYEVKKTAEVAQGVRTIMYDVMGELVKFEQKNSQDTKGLQESGRDYDAVG